jgi:DNA replication protein DnaC
VRLRQPAQTSRLLRAIGQLAIDTGRTVAWFSIEELGALVRKHRADDTITKAIRRITRVDLIMVDDIGMRPVCDRCHRRLPPARRRLLRERSLGVSSNLHPAGFDEIMPKHSPPPQSTGYSTMRTSA